VRPELKRKLRKIPVRGERERDDENHGSDYGGGFSHTGIVSIFPDYGEGKSCVIGMPYEPGIRMPVSSTRTVLATKSPTLIPVPTKTGNFRSRATIAKCESLPHRRETTA
jgi:hypothetical protein